MASALTRGRAANPSRGNSSFDLGGTAIGGVLDLLNGGGRVYTPGSGGGYIDRSAERAAAQQSYQQAEADRANVYGQAVGEVKARNPQIQAGYDKGTADLQENARARAIADRAAQNVRQQQAAQAASAYGLPVAPPATTRTDEVVEGNIGQYQTNADSWQGFNTGAASRAIERNNAVGDAFTWQGAQQQQALAALLQQALGGLQDEYYGGSSGGWSGGLNANQQLSGWESLLGFSDKDFDNDLNAAKFLQGTATRGGPDSRSRSHSF